MRLPARGAARAIRALLCTTGAMLLAAQPLRADDTEIYVSQAGANPDAGRANILFIIDNSGSMEAQVQTQVPWNTATRFTGCYDSDAIYFGTSTTPPPCGSMSYIARTSNRCAASHSVLASLGQYTGLALGWDPGRERWDPLVENDPGRLLECQADGGADGAGSELFAANGPEGPWGPDDSQEPAWNTQYTLFDGNWLNWRTNPPTVTLTRLEIVQRVVTGILDNMSGVNVGLMQFNFTDGGAITHQVADIATAREEVKAAVNRLTPFSRTPLSETLYEATLYLRGGLVDFGNIGPEPSVAAARVGGNAAGQVYLSPVTAECQKNFIVLLTDGEPSNDNEAIQKTLDLPDFRTLVGTNCDGTGEGRCLDDIAEYLFKADLDPDLDGVQNAVTYTIGFEVDAPILQSTAGRGGGRYFTADDTGSLATALTEVVTGIVEQSGTFTAPTIPVSAFNRSAEQRDVFVSVFQPAGTAHWPGNLKKYRFRDNQLLDQNDENAVDPATGFFAEDAFSYWSPVADGNRVSDGGAASRLPEVRLRKLYTDINGNDLTSSGNRVEVANTAITAAMLGVAPVDRDALIRWIRGADVRDLDTDGDAMEPRHQMGDPLHVRPVTLDYGTSENDPDTTIFLATNDGLLHSIDAVTGGENWAYLPGRLLSRQNELMLNIQSPVRRYGLDGEIRLFVRNSDRRPGIVSGDQAILLFGMGRGGTAVFAVDVTDPAAPRLLWQIDSSSPGFASLGQTWSAPEVTRIRIGTQEHLAVVLSGGYDDAQDNRGYRTDTVGNAVFLVDLTSGELLWSAGAPGAGHDLTLPAMHNSIPAALRVLDLTGDGLADRLYVGDTGGQLWRFDLLNGNDRANLGEGGVLAALGAAGLASPAPGEVRRFYPSPDVVLVNCVRGSFLALNIGSGFRGHPLDTDAADAFFSVRDKNVYLPVLTADYPAPVSATELLDITGDPAAVVPADSPGWRLQMIEDSGEKVLTPAQTFNNTVFFTSFSPGGSVNACVGGLGVNRAYAVDACNGRPVFNLDAGTEPGPLGVDDRFRIVPLTGIASGTIVLGTDATLFIGPSSFDIQGPLFGRTFWMQEPAR